MHIYNIFRDEQFLTNLTKKTWLQAISNTTYMKCMFDIMVQQNQSEPWKFWFSSVIEFDQKVTTNAV